jgi:hypothetical protein
MNSARAQSLLPSTCLAIEAARTELVGLPALIDDPFAFRDAFTRCIAMICRVGPVLLQEAKGRKTPEFGEFWDESERDDLLQFLKKVRNADFKRGETRIRPKARMTAHVGDTGKLRAARRGRDEIYITPVLPLPPGAEYHVTWNFVGGRFHDGDVLALLERHMLWLTALIELAAQRLKPWPTDVVVQATLPVTSLERP